LVVVVFLVELHELRFNRVKLIFNRGRSSFSSFKLALLVDILVDADAGSFCVRASQRSEVADFEYLALDAVSNNVELLLDDTLANADDDDDLGLRVAVKPVGRFWQQFTVVGSAVGKDENSVENIWTIADGLEECVVNGEIQSLGGFGSFSFIWNICDSFKKVSFGVVVVWFDTENWVFIEGNDSNSSLIFANWQILDESNNVFSDVVEVLVFDRRR